ncbi:MAG TPA: hypothetical protein VFP35_04495 [Candidatus Saccharimonadales bacterium]|nr:hypothetical protein [Candidatus Saccharimonadales bacterium]
MSPFERWLIAVSLNLLGAASAIFWRQCRNGGVVSLGRFSVSGVVPALVGAGGVALMTGDILYIYA